MWAHDFKPVVVRWRDAHQGEGYWHSLADVDDDEPHVIESCGWMIPTDDGGKSDHVTLAQNVDPAGLVDHVIYIPSEMVVSVVFLEAFTAPLSGRLG